MSGHGAWERLLPSLDGCMATCLFLGLQFRFVLADECLDLVRVLQDPLFPATHIAVGTTCQFEVMGLERKHWSTANPIRIIFREAFERAGLPYLST